MRQLAGIKQRKEERERSLNTLQGTTQGISICILNMTLVTLYTRLL